MYHGRGVESEFVRTEREFVAFFHYQLVGQFGFEETRKHIESFGVADDNRVRIFDCKCENARAVVGFHMRNHEIVGLSAVKGVVEVVEPFLDFCLVNRIHNGDFSSSMRYEL